MEPDPSVYATIILKYERTGNGDEIETTLDMEVCLKKDIMILEKERVLDDGAEESYTLRDMAECLRKNKYLLIFFAAPLISGLLNVGANWGLYVARYCFGGEEIASYVSMTVIIPTIIGAVMAVELCKKLSLIHISEPTRH